MRRTTVALLLLPAWPMWIACNPEPAVVPAPVQPLPPPSPPVITEPHEFAMVTEARVQYPRFIDVEKKVIARTCSPNPGVCHQTNNYPDMHTAGNALAMILARCNLEIPDPRQGWDGCEQVGDRLWLGEVGREIGWLTKSGGDWIATLREAAPETATVPLEVYTAEDQIIFAPPIEWSVEVSLTEGSKEAVIKANLTDPYILDFVDSVMQTAVGGDTNQNGIYGADAPETSGVLVWPGSLEKSYLWGRITGTVPGSRMPLANQPLSNAEYVAIGCWIEGLDPDGEPSAVDAIDYDSCRYAKNPVDYFAR